MKNKKLETKLEINLEKVLLAKEARRIEQQKWIDKYNMPLISLTLVTPGSVKDSDMWRKVMKYAFECCNTFLKKECLHSEFNQIVSKMSFLETGAEAFWSVPIDAIYLKNSLIEIEQKHCLGRLWDFDVICPKQGSINRSTLEIKARKCLVCDDIARICVRTKKHSHVEIIQVIENLVAAFDHK